MDNCPARAPKNMLPCTEHADLHVAARAAAATSEVEEQQRAGWGPASGKKASSSMADTQGMGWRKRHQYRCVRHLGHLLEVLAARRQLPHRWVRANRSGVRALDGELRLNQRVDSLDDLPAARAILYDVTPRELLRIAGRACQPPTGGSSHDTGMV
jgi:hypothetical protein